ncbi:MAG: hypothetical protein RLZZ381_887 [Cyanobacteriota bacterium]|jgi:hypothetical protein
MTDSFLEPTESNFGSLIIKNGSGVSNKIKELIETTKSWLKIESVLSEDDQVEVQQELKPLESIEVDLKRYLLGSK